MEANKSEAENCLKLARKYLKQGNTDKGIKFVRKAESLYTTEYGKGIFKFIYSFM